VVAVAVVVVVVVVLVSDAVELECSAVWQASRELWANRSGWEEVD
jgi:hypothetical protein